MLPRQTQSQAKLAELINCRLQNWRKARRRKVLKLDSAISTALLRRLRDWCGRPASQSRSQRCVQLQHNRRRSVVNDDANCNWPCLFGVTSQYGLSSAADHVSICRCIYARLFATWTEEKRKETDRDRQISCCTKLTYILLPPQKKNCVNVTKKFSKDTTIISKATNRQIITIKQISHRD